MRKEYNVDIGRNVDKRYVLDFKKENGVIIAGYAGSGKTNLINHIKSQLIVDDCEIFNYNKKMKNFDIDLEERFKDNLVLESNESKVLKELKKHKKEIESRIKKLNKLNLSYEDSDISIGKDRFIFIDEFSIELINLKILNNERYKEYLGLIKFIIEEGSKYGYRMIIVGMRCRNSDIPEVLSNIISCKISFTNPYEDLEVWGLIEEGMKYPKKVGELLIVSNTFEDKTFVKSYNIEDSFKENKF